MLRLFEQMLTFLIFIIVIGVLIFIHELGHFWMAKRAGMKVEEFGFGFPPRIFGIKKGETTYSINWIPFGGFVKILGEDGSGKDNPRSFASKSTGVRAVVIVAGVVMNLLLAAALLIIGNGVGLRVGINSDIADRARNLKVQIIQVAENSPAQMAGLRILDEVKEITIDGQNRIIADIAEIQSIIKANKGREIELKIQRGSKIEELKVIPRTDPPPGEGALGISLALTGVIKYPWHQAVYRGIQDTYFITRETAFGYGRIIGNLFTTGQAGMELSGPIGIAVITGQAARTGFAYLIQLVALISINLAILNIIPFPALDGGRLLFIIIEAVIGRPAPKRVEVAVNAVGFALLILLMVFVTTRDIIKFF